MSRPTVAEIDLAALLQNFKQVREKVKAPLICPILKANAYGHGALLIAKALAPLGITFWGVHSLEEALPLRQEKISGDILLLGGSYPEEIEEIVVNRLTPVLHDRENFRALLAELKNQRTRAVQEPLKVHLKLDTGMGRFGFRPEALPAFLDEYLSQKEMKIAGVFAHLPLSEDPAFNASQRRIFDEGLAQLSARGISPGVRHHSNSLVSILDPTLHYDMVRPGLILYGVPSHESLKKEVAVKPVMTFLTRIVSIREVPAGVGLSYGHTFRTSRNSRIATLPVGYADGYPRACGNRASVVIRGRRFPVVGRVCMDLTLVDITDDPSIVRGERVTLFGSADSGGGEVPVQEIAKIQDTIAYEILCGISPRVPRIIRRVEPGANAS